MVNRYDTHEVMGMIRDDDGLYVLYEDYAALEAATNQIAAERDDLVCVILEQEKMINYARKLSGWDERLAEAAAEENKP